MEADSSKQIISELKKGSFRPIYILHGEEPYFIDEVVAVAENEILSESEKAFNQSILYGRDVDAKKILDHARQFPMMAERRVVILKEAQSMRDIKSLESYILNPTPQTVLVIAHKKKLDGRIKWMKEAKKQENVVLYESKAIPEYRMANWLTQKVKEEGMKISGPAVEMLIQYLGTDLKKVSNEIEKIKVNIDAGSTIDIPIIERYIGISRDFDVYALLRALSYGDTAKAQQIATNIEGNEKAQPLQMILPGMASYFEKVLIVAQNFKKDDRSLGSLIGTYGSFVKEYREMAKRYGYEGLINVYHLLVEADGYSKGLGRRRQDGILKELIGRMLMHQRQT